MKFLLLSIVSLGLLWTGTVRAGENQIKSAESAGPASVSKDATIMDWNQNVLRKGNNGWTCLPDNPNTPGTDPWCVNEPWLNFLDAYMTKKEPSYSQLGIGYMLQGDTPVSNTDPYAKEKKPGNEWVEGIGAHLMLLVPDKKALTNIPTDPKNGGPWIMWRDTPYVHVMVPVESYPPKQ